MKTATASTPCKPAGTKAELKDCFPPLKATQKRCSEPNCNWGEGRRYAYRTCPRTSWKLPASPVTSTRKGLGFFLLFLDSSLNTSLNNNSLEKNQKLPFFFLKCPVCNQMRQNTVYDSVFNSLWLTTEVPHWNHLYFYTAPAFIPKCQCSPWSRIWAF